MTVEHAALVVDARATPQHEPFLEIRFGPPLTLTGRPVRAGKCRIIGARPTAERNLRVWVDNEKLTQYQLTVLDVREESAPLFRVGIDPKLARNVADQPATITLDGVDYDARFVGFRPDLDAQTRTRTALFEIDTRDPVYLASGTLTLETALDQQGYAVPLRALRDGVRGLWTVMVLEPEDGDVYTARAAAVEVLQIQGDTAYVRGTLQGAAMIVPDGTHRLVPGDRVQIAGVE